MLPRVLAFRGVPVLWRRFNGVVWFPLLGAFLFVGSLVPALHSHGTQFGGMPSRPYDVLAVVAVGLQCAPLAVCRRWPVACCVLVAVGFAVDQLRGYHSFAGTALAFAVFNLGLRLERRRRVAALVLTVGYVAFSAVFPLLGGGETLPDLVAFYVAMVFVWGIGSLLRATKAAEAERRRRVAEETRAAERARIAADLHDVVTHHVTAMVVQAEAARYLANDPGRLDDSLTVVTDTGRQALTDLRHLLDVLDPGTPGLRALVDRTRKAGQPVEFTEEGTPVASPVAYRVVQEALTNALKYAHGSPTSVQVRHGDQEITVEVSTDGANTQDVGGSGRGLAGLRDRIDLLGGDFSAGRRPGGGFYVRASIPAGSPP
jgi:signal transduction histidine kinase